MKTKDYSIYYCDWCKYGHSGIRWDTMKIYGHPDNKIVECLKCKSRFVWMKKKVKSGLPDMKNKFKTKKNKIVEWLSCR